MYPALRRASSSVFQSFPTAAASRFVSSASGGDAVVVLEEEKRKRKQLVELEMQTQRLQGNFFVPDDVPDAHWEPLLEMPTFGKRLKYYRYLKTNEINKVRKARKLADNIEEYKRRMARVNSGPTKYGLGQNAMFMRIFLPSCRKIYDANLANATQFGQKLVIDLGYEAIMNRQELNSVVVQITCLYKHVRRDRDAFHLHVCNADPGGFLAKALKERLPYLMVPDALVTVTERSYLDLFPREKIVYLVPNCNSDLQYDHDDVYVVGGLVDRRDQGPASKTKALKEGVRIATLPFDKYVKWQRGNKTLTIDQVVKILSTMKQTDSWESAFQHLPKRKVSSGEEYERWIESNYLDSQRWAF